jgi:hypothetical protein
MFTSLAIPNWGTTFPEEEASQAYWANPPTAKLDFLGIYVSKMDTVSCFTVRVWLPSGYAKQLANWEINLLHR